jgi:hypothetical protein
MRFAFFLRPLLALTLCVTAWPAAAQLFDPMAPIRVVYRVDTTPPISAFTGGFNAGGTNENLLALTSGDSCLNPVPIAGAAGFVTMTADRQQAALFAQRYLDNTPWIGPNRPFIYIYAIRADPRFISVPGAFYTAIDAGMGRRAGFRPEHAQALEYLLYSRPILGEQAVVASQVDPDNIRSATGLWLENGALVESGQPAPNVGYVHDAFSAATNVVDDWRLSILLPPDEIPLARGGTSGTCLMVCNAPVWSSSFSGTSGTDRASVCSGSDAISPLLLDIINDD